MPPDRPTPADRDAGLLWDMLEYARLARRFTTGRTFEQYQADDMLRAAVERAVMIIGEAAAKVSRPFREAHPEVAWTAIIAQRHIVVHEYGRVDHSKIWRVATFHVPSLIEQLERLVPTPPPDPLPEPEAPRDPDRE